ncbi:unnamed protein product [Coffea canephora]|uniref:Cellulose synthase n=1 Tax=Coffea canephora TaxID=49390 RepID=A0A068UBU4_COFCA|nr:unnamed protein product [Coffea canephora]
MVPFCKKFNIEPRTPEWYFAQKIDYLKDKIQPSFVRERRVMKREYEEFKVRLNVLVAKAQKVPEKGWTMPDGTPWPGNSVRDHPGMIQVFVGQSSGDDMYTNKLPQLVYVSREKKPGFNYHKKVGPTNALVRVSAILSNAIYLLILDCDHYINNSKVQFPQRFDGIDTNDRYANRNTVFFDINMKGLDGIQGPIYVGTGCVFRRLALYGYDAPKKNKSPARTCNCSTEWCWSRLCAGHKKIKKKRKAKSETNVHAMEGLKEGAEVDYFSNPTNYTLDHKPDWVIVGVSRAINNGYDSWGPLLGKVFFAIWVIVHLYPFLKGLLGRQNRTSTTIVVLSLLVASLFSLLWVHIDLFLANSNGPVLEEYGIDCEKL